MNKTKFYAYAGAIALLSIGFTACSSEDEVVNSPNYDAATNSVKTTFVINIATGSTPTRSSAATAQYVATGTPTFRGMEEMNLFTFTDRPYNQDFTSGNHYALGSLGTNAIGNSDDLPSNRFYNLFFPLNTNNMLFYGKALKNGTDKEQGKITWTMGETKDATSFALAPRLDGTTYTATIFQNRATVIAAIMNVICAAQYTNEGTTTTWKSTLQNEDPMYQSLKVAYQRLTTVGANELRLGSGYAVFALLSKLKSAMNDIGGNTAMPMIVRGLANNIAERIGYFLTDSDWRTPSAMAEHLDGEARTIAASLAEGDIKGFPENMGMPAGSAQMTCNLAADGTATFGYTYEPAAIKGGAVSISKIMFPAELTYWSCSPINVSDEDVPTADYPKTTSTWDAATWTGHVWTKKGKILSSTQSVAMTNNIHYGTALLQTSVGYAADAFNGSKIELEDNRKALHADSPDETNQMVEVAAASKLTLTGVLIGGQPSTMGWNWVRKSTTDAFDNIIYDNSVAGGSAVNIPITSGSYSDPNYTVVFDNYDSSKGTDGQNNVLIALEFMNATGTDFWGADNLIPNNSHFYLVGELKLDETSRAAITANYPVNTDGDGYRCPPVDADGKNVVTPRIFTQDFVTIAKFKLSKDALQKAYATVPDLQATQIRFGLSVDLMWRSGATFEIEL